MITSSSLRRSVPTLQGRKGFSLVEILIVIAIIAVLAAIAMPIAGKIRRSSKIEKNREIAVALELAFERFYNEYGYLPASNGPVPTFDKEYSSDEESFVSILEELSGEGDSLSYNTKGINYLNALPEAKSKTSGILRNKSGDIRGLISSFGGGFGVILDYTYDEELEEPTDFDGKTINGSRSLIWAFDETEVDEKAKETSVATSWR